MKLVIEITLPEAAIREPCAYASMVHNMLQVVWRKLEGILGRSVCCVCTAPEADDQIRDMFGRVVGSLSLRCDCGANVRTGYTLCANCYAKLEEENR